MGIFDGSLADTIARLVQSPRVQYGAKQLGSFGSYGSGPFRTQSPQRMPLTTRMGNRSNSGMSGDYDGIGASINGIGQILAGMSGGQPQAQQNDPLMDLYEQLMNQLQAPVNMPTGVNTDDLMRQVKAAINPIYDQRASAAEERTTRATGQVKDMYRTLANDYERLAPEQIAQANANKAEVEKLYGTLRSNVKGDYARVSSEQAELFKQLGIEDALPEVLEEQSAPVEDALIAASENQTQQMQRAQDIGQMDATFYREGSPNAVMAGNEISTDMLSQLNEYLNQVEAERSAGIQGGYMDQLSQANSQLAQQQQAAQGEQGRRQEMLWQMLQGQLNQKQQPVELNPDTFMQGLPPNVQQSVAGAFTRLQRSPEAVYGKVEDRRNPVPGSFVETTPEWYMAQADEMLKRGELDPTTHQALLMYLQLNFQK